MKYLSVLFSAFFIYACSSGCEDCEQSDVKELTEIKNDSDKDVCIIFVGDDSTTINIDKSSSFFFDDTAYSALIPRCECGLFSDGCDSKPLDVYLKFQSDVPQCVAFTGEIRILKHDIRFIESYEKVGEEHYVGITTHNYRYTIDSTLVEMAKPCE